MSSESLNNSNSLYQIASAASHTASTTLEVLSDGVLLWGVAAGIGYAFNAAQINAESPIYMASAMLGVAIYQNLFWQSPYQNQKSPVTHYKVDEPTCDKVVKEIFAERRAKVEHGQQTHRRYSSSND